MADFGANSLTPTQQRALAALLTERDVRSAATATGVSERSLHRWLADPVFQAELRAAEAALLTEISRRLVGLSVEALEVLGGLLEDGSPGVRLRAAGLILAHLLPVRELAVFEERLTRLEERAGDYPQLRPTT